MPKKVLEQDWSKYDTRKIIGNQDRRDFYCTEKWEVEFLIKKIQALHPEYTSQKIEIAINDACQISEPPHSRIEFVGRVIGFLKSS